MSVTREIFLRKPEARYREVSLPACGLTVRIRSLTEAEKTNYERALYDKKGEQIPGRLKDSRARLICLCLVDDEGKQLLLPGDEQDVLELDSADTSALWDACWEHVGFQRQPVVDDAKN